MKSESRHNWIRYSAGLDGEYRCTRCDLHLLQKRDPQSTGPYLDFFRRGITGQFIERDQIPRCRSSEFPEKVPRLRPDAKVVWFEEPGKTCSLCGKKIPQNQKLMLYWDNVRRGMLRLHQLCFYKVIE